MASSVWICPFWLIKDKSCSLLTKIAVNGLDENKKDNVWMHKSVTLQYEPCDETSISNESIQICGVAMFRWIKNVFLTQAITTFSMVPSKSGEDGPQHFEHWNCVYATYAQWAEPCAHISQHNPRAGDGFFATYTGNEERVNIPQAVEVTPLENGERYRHAVMSFLCEIDRYMKLRVEMCHVTPTKFEMATNMATEQENIAVVVKK